MSPEDVEEIDWSSRFFELAGVMLLVFAPDGRVVHISSAGAEILGRARDDVLGQDWFEAFLPERVRAEVRTVFEQVAAGAVGAPERQGFGSKVIAGSIARELGGTVEMDFRPAGLRATLTMPLARVTATPPGLPNATDRPT